jgi:hypothetical protein
MSLPHLKPIVDSGFVQALRTGQLQTCGHQSRVAAIVKGGIGLLVQTFPAYCQKDPTCDPNGQLSPLLS